MEEKWSLYSDITNNEFLHDCIYITVFIVM